MQNSLRLETTGERMGKATHFPVEWYVLPTKAVKLGKKGPQ